MKSKIKICISAFLVLLPISISALEHVKLNDTKISPPATNHCNNGVKDADETGIDCGGALCKPCGGIPIITPKIKIKPIFPPGISTTWKPKTFFNIPLTPVIPGITCEPELPGNDTNNSDNTSGPRFTQETCTTNAEGKIVEIYNYSDGTTKQYDTWNYCNRDGTGTEFQCNNQKLSLNRFKCWSGYVCSDGRCVAEKKGGDSEFCSPYSQTSPASDGSQQPQGVTLIITTSDGQTINFGGDNHCEDDAVYTAYCDGNHISYHITQCTNGQVCNVKTLTCQDPTPSCYDNGNGTLGGTGAAGNNSTQSTNQGCSLDKKSRSFFTCDGDYLKLNDELCPDGTECKKGTCQKKLPLCH